MDIPFAKSSHEASADISTGIRSLVAVDTNTVIASEMRSSSATTIKGNRNDISIFNLLMCSNVLVHEVDEFEISSISNCEIAKVQCNHKQLQMYR